MKLLFCGDVIGRTGRDAVCAQVPALRDELGLDLVLVNGENAAAGFGITAKICEQFFAAGVDVITTGNHVWDQREIIAHIGKEPRLLRPANFPPGTPGAGIGLYRDARGRKTLVVHIMARLFMNPLDDPFACADQALEAYKLGANVDAIVVDFHGEATSEKMAMAHYLDGRVSMVVGTHSHIPTADAQVLPGGTAYQTDLGMCGDYDSVIGMVKETSVERFVRKMPTARMEPAKGAATLCAALVETDDDTGQAVSIVPVRLGGRLIETRP